MVWFVVLEIYTELLMDVFMSVLKLEDLKENLNYGIALHQSAKNLTKLESKMLPSSVSDWISCINFFY